MKHGKWYWQMFFVLLVGSIVFHPVTVLAGKSVPATTFQIPDRLRLERMFSSLEEHWSSRFGTRRMLAWPAAHTYAGPPEMAARLFLQDHPHLLGMQAEQIGQLEVAGIRHSAFAEHVRFQQYYQGIPVFSGQAVVSLDRHTGKVLLLNNHIFPDVRLENTLPALSAFQAEQTVQQQVGITGTYFDEKQVELVIFPMERDYALCWRVILPSREPFGVWEGFVDAMSGRLLALRDRTWQGQRGDRTRLKGRLAQGIGKVFHPNAVVATRNDLLQDMNDSDQAVPDSAYLLVPLRRLTFDPADSLYYLSGPHVNITDRESPANTPATSPNGEFLFTRNPDEFEDVMCYFHVDSFYSYVEGVLGHTLTGTILDALDIDSNGFQGADNSHFVGSANPYIAFGHGGVDDAEDAEIILHEYGHAMHFAIVGDIGLTIQNGSFSEGFGDVLGYAAYMANGASGGYHDEFIGDWDAVSYNPGPPPYLRRADGLGYPNGQPFQPSLCNEVHDCGEFFSAATWEITQNLGAELMLQLVIGSLYFQTAADDYQQISMTILMADQSLYGGAHASQLIAALDHWGLLDASTLIPTIHHQPLPDTEDPIGPYPVVAEILPTFAPLVLDSLFVYFSTDSSFSQRLPLLPTGQPNQYRADIPSQGMDVTIQYYLSVQDSTGLVTTVPAGAPQNFYSFRVGLDTLPPVIVHEPIAYGDRNQLPIPISTRVTDNIGVDSVWVEFFYNGTAQAPFPLLPDTVANVYQGYFVLDSQVVQVGDSVRYRILARDSAQMHNLATTPYYSFQIIQILQSLRTVALAIPDNNPVGVRDTLLVENETPFLIADVDFHFKAQHTWFGDLKVSLTGPNGQQAVLIDRPGVPGSTYGNPGNNPDLILDDEASESVEDIASGGSDDISGTYRPFPDSLALFDGLNPAGSWIIQVSDNASGDTGVLQRWGFTFRLFSATTGIGQNEEKETVPARYVLHPNYPNPFNPSTTVAYQLPRTSQVRLEVYNVLGQRVRTLVKGKLAAGRYRSVWDGRNEQGQAVATGVYILRLQAEPVAGQGDPFVQVRKMVLVK